MGKPINKRNFGNAEDKIQVSRYRRATGNTTDGDDSTHIVAQKGTRKFVVGGGSGNSAWTEILWLVSDKATTETLNPGTFMIVADNSDGADTRVDKLFNNSVVLNDGSTLVREGWDVADVPTADRESPDPSAGRARIDGQAS